MNNIYCPICNKLKNKRFKTCSHKCGGILHPNGYPESLMNCVTGYKTMIKGRFKCKNPDKYLGNVNNIIYRSSYELKMFMKLDHDPSVLAWSSEEIQIPYQSPIDGKLHRYYPDIFIKIKNEKGEIEETIGEIKPFHQTLQPIQNNNRKKFLKECITYATNLAKWEAAKRYCKQRGWAFKILTERELKIPMKT